MSRTDDSGRSVPSRPRTRASGPKPASARATAPTPVQERRFSGQGIYPGIAIGPVAFAAEAPAPVAPRNLQSSEIAFETARLDEAVQRSLRQLEKLKSRLAFLSEESQAEIAPLLDVYRQMLGPSRLLRNAAARIVREKLNAEAAVMVEAEALAQLLTPSRLPGAVALDGEEAAAALRRAEEVREIGRRLIRNLTRAPFRSFAKLPAGVILVTEQLRPSDAALIDPARIAGVVMDDGGTADHTAIMLRALGIPAVLGVAGITAQARAGCQIVVDGGAGLVTLDPSPDSIQTARRDVVSYAKERQRLGRLRRLPAKLTGGEAVELQANLELPAELPLIAQAGAAGIGLLRTEFLFINADTLPDELEQEEAYRSIIDAMGGECTTIRLLDWGGEKQSEALSSVGFFTGTTDLNPALGLRGLRLLLQNPLVMETQLAAILRAARDGHVRILLPMVTTLAELRMAREIYDRVVRRLRRRGVRLPDKLPQLGIMIETPAAALGAETLALEAEFLAIGTNDLTMYTLAVDRASNDVASLYDPLHPAVLRLIGHATDAALRLRRPVSLCGEIAGNPLVVPLLMGMGLRSFSMNASAIPRVKQVVRQAALDECRRLARRVMEESDPHHISRLLTEFAAR
ncbi:phosphoenolpyruvate--protein phosphotransferase [Lichenicola cladoniae]|uniref:Phosphoenolpyruvate-protein phosphotransferase n=1 Tax=Lichenicola cladoniae TaxID=1484109 RepID=A0A6M8HUK0_9PROT|nr:phosphoenolpyruvate--protein phosphotransferase [Lichenicola cladoniae]NPD69398.1 phosphoenolpyruvate--protein phosphotransferase [Acetobacteraceae bacterium]QKE92219.1 phosphoenolpyruvate--protein phosphotransferase [Lichenicola cladoniae]